ncbi:MAG TPA: FGGY family carbohydrate kinase [Chitinophagaceae bacterium]
MRAIPVIAVIDVGKTNKKLFLFNQQYKIVYERSARFTETEDEDGFPCENIESLRLSVFDSLRCVFSKKEYDVKAINFSSYGASLVYIDDEGNPLTPLYNYLKPYPELLRKKFYDTYGGEESFAVRTASPVLGSLNSGMQLYRLKYEKPEIFKNIRYALHLPQYLSYLITGQPCSDITSIGCHTNLWDFQENDYHEWVRAEGVAQMLAPLVRYDKVMPAAFPGSNYLVGPGLHDSSASLIPYLVNFQEPFVLISTGTWCITLNPYDDSPLQLEELEHDCLCYYQYDGRPVKASRLFAGQHHEDGIKIIASHFHQNPVKYRSMQFNPEVTASLKRNNNGQLRSTLDLIRDNAFAKRNITDFNSDEEAYHRLMMDILESQVASTQLVLKGPAVKRMFVDGGFSKNAIYMNLLAAAFPNMEIYAASVAQATALGAALSIHKSWNKKPLPNDMIQLQYYGSLVKTSI